MSILSSICFIDVLCRYVYLIFFLYFYIRLFVCFTRIMRMFGQTNAEDENDGQPLVTPDMDGRLYQTVTAVPAIVLEESPKSTDVKRSTYYRI